MLALLAALVMSPARVLPEPFLSTELQPILPVEHLRGEPRVTVARGGSWRPGGLVRLSYFYKFPKGKGPSHEDFLSEPGFLEEPSRFGMNPSLRAARTRDGIRQTVSISDLDEGVTWKWARITGPATVVAVSELPLEEAILPVWHDLAVLNHPPLPPGCPPDFGFLRNTHLMRVDSEPIIPRIYRISVSMIVKLASVEHASKLIEAAQKELDPTIWKWSGAGKGQRMAKRATGYGLQSIVIVNTSVPSPSRLSEISLTYTFADPENAPRIEN